MQCHLPVATATTTAGICANMEQAAGNAMKYADLANKIVEQAGPSQPDLMPGAPQPTGSGPSIMGTVAKAAVLGMCSVVAPAPTAIASVFVAGMEAAHFGLKNKVGAGEMTMAQVDAADAFEKGIYISACDGLSSSVASGKPVASPMAQTPNKLAGMQNINEIVKEEMSGLTEKEMVGVQSFLKKRASDNIAVVDNSLLNLEKRGAISANDKDANKLRGAMDYVSETIAEMTAQKPKALPLKAGVGMTGSPVGMGGPSFA